MVQGEDAWLQCEHRRLVKFNNRHGILDIQNRMIALQESKRSLDGIVNGFWDDDSSHGSVSEEFGALVQLTRFLILLSLATIYGRAESCL